MAEYIERASAIEAVNDRWNLFEDEKRVLRRAIKSIPAADVAPVVRGRWITTGDNWVVCSECKTLGSPRWKGCPVCLARMDGE